MRARRHLPTDLRITTAYLDESAGTWLLVTKDITPAATPVEVRES
jgi:hypothetical protein